MKITSLLYIASVLIFLILIVVTIANALSGIPKKTRIFKGLDGHEHANFFVSFLPCTGTGNTLAEKCWKDGREYGEQLVDHNNYQIEFNIEKEIEPDDSEANKNINYNFVNVIPSGKGTLDNWHISDHKDFSWRLENNQIFVNFSDNKTTQFKIEDEIYLIYQNEVYLIETRSTCRDIPIGEWRTRGILGMIQRIYATVPLTDPFVNINGIHISLNFNSEDINFISKYIGKYVDITYTLYQYWENEIFTDGSCRKKNVIKSIKLIK